ncbi:MAG: hypothetical protein HC916_20155 [Coleofasciculaceae cyanobacterium SM2_1_6]|nr:hypothetical protein [Coleofasciculaceae cyanobacterium SM2_1_6]
MNGMKLLQTWSADYVAPTPTAAAIAVIPPLADLRQHHQDLTHRLKAATHQRLAQETKHLQHLQQRLEPSRLDREITREKQVITYQQQRLISATKQRLQLATQHLYLLEQKLQALDPHAILQRGYAVVRSSRGKILRAGDQITVGQSLDIQLSQRTVKAKITEITEVT